jgi:orotate phosphoribosyltransferase
LDFLSRPAVLRWDFSIVFQFFATFLQTSLHMNQTEILELFRQQGALLEGHFRLTSGFHSDRYLQCALVLQHPHSAAALGKALAEKMLKAQDKPQLVIAPALGGILVAHEVARALGVRGIFAERQDGTLRLRRGFMIDPGECCFVVEDVVTTGGSTMETMEVVRQCGGIVSAAGALIDRTGGKADLGVPRVALAVLDVPMYPPENCPLCKAGSQAIKPGSR